MCDVSEAALARVPAYFAPEYVQAVGGHALDYAAFVAHMAAQKTKLAGDPPPRCEWQELVAAGPRGGRVFVTSVHRVTAT